MSSGRASVRAWRHSHRHGRGDNSHVGVGATRGGVDQDAIGGIHTMGGLRQGSIDVNRARSKIVAKATNKQGFNGPLVKTYEIPGQDLALQLP